MLGLGTELVRRGHAVRCLGPRAMQPGVERAGIAFVPTKHAPERSAAARIPSAEGWPLIQELWNGPSYGLDLRDEAGRRRPDAVVIDDSLVGAMNAAQDLELPRAALVRVVGGLAYAAMQGALPGVDASPSAARSRTVQRAAGGGAGTRAAPFAGVNAVGDRAGGDDDAGRRELPGEVARGGRVHRGDGRRGVERAGHRGVAGGRLGAPSRFAGCWLRLVVSVAVARSLRGYLIDDIWVAR